MTQRYKDLSTMQTELLERAQKKLSLNSEDYTYDEDLLAYYFDDAIDIIRDWKKLTSDSLILTGIYDRNIVQFIIESINMTGLEGQSSSSANGVSKTFIASPESNLKSSIPQSM